MFENSVCRGDDPDVHFLRSAVAHAVHDAFLKRAQELHLQVLREFTDLIEEQSATVGDLELAGREATAPVNAPRTCPKSSLSMRASGMAPQLMTTKGPVARLLRRWISWAMSSLPVPVSPVMRTEMSVVATFWSLRKTSSIDEHEPMISPNLLSLSSETSFSLSARSAFEEQRVLQNKARLPRKDRKDVELVAVEEAFHSVISDVEHALDVSLRHQRRAHDAREARARTLSLELNSASVSASLTMTGVPSRAPCERCCR